MAWMRVASIKILLSLVVFLIAGICLNASANAESTEVFDGERFIITITEHCPEGFVSCENVTFVSKNKKTGSGITLKGKTVNINCPATCDFRGYEFKNGLYTYSLLTNDFAGWNLNVFKGNKLLSTDTGKME
ncbi:hypothetical protein [Erwinia mallotivora]|nr:hypothetical protein [Erwinia mallotivora]